MKEIPPSLRSTEAWSIADVERDTGLSKDTLRIWERRYGFPNPQRDDTGNRLYNRAEVQRLMLIKRLLDAGHRPNKVVPLESEELQALLQDTRTKGAPPRKTHTLSIHETLPWDEWLQHLLNGDASALRSALHQQIWQHGLTRTIEHIIAPLNRHVGEAWHDQKLSVYQEHIYTEVVQSLLRESLGTIESNTPPLEQNPKVLLSTLSGERHGLGLLMAECWFAVSRCRRLSLGLDTPVSEILLAAKNHAIDIVAISLSSYASGRETLEQLQRLSQSLPETTEIWLGGSSALLSNKRLPGSSYVLGAAAEIPGNVQAWQRRHSQPRTA